jgi:puromycin-sensitive aminopeptidase
VWERITGGLSILDRLVDGDARDALHGRIAALVGPVRAELGADAGPGDDDRSRTLRGVLLQAAALLGDDGAARDRAAELLDRFLAHPPSVDPSLASPALAVCATLGDVALHERLVAAFREAANPQDRQRLQLALARFRDPEALQRTLELTLSGDVRTQDAPYLLGETLTNRDSGPLAWAFVGAHWDEIEARFPANSLARLVGGIRSVRERALADEITAFLDAHPIPQGDKQVRQHIERMGVTVALAERESARFTAALTS